MVTTKPALRWTAAVIVSIIAAFLGFSWGLMDLTSVPVQGEIRAIGPCTAPTRHPQPSVAECVTVTGYFAGQTVYLEVFAPYNFVPHIGCPLAGLKTRLAQFDVITLDHNQHLGCAAPFHRKT